MGGSLSDSRKRRTQRPARSTFYINADGEDLPVLPVIFSYQAFHLSDHIRCSLKSGRILIIFMSGSQGGTHDFQDTCWQVRLSEPPPSWPGSIYAVGGGNIPPHPATLPLHGERESTTVDWLLFFGECCPCLNSPHPCARPGGTISRMDEVGGLLDRAFSPSLPTPRPTGSGSGDGGTEGELHRAGPRSGLAGQRAVSLRGAA